MIKVFIEILEQANRIREVYNLSDDHRFDVCGESPAYSILLSRTVRLSSDKASCVKCDRLELPTE